MQLTVLSPVLALTAASLAAIVSGESETTTLAFSNEASLPSSAQNLSRSDHNQLESNDYMEEFQPIQDKWGAMLGEVFSDQPSSDQIEEGSPRLCDDDDDDDGSESSPSSPQCVNASDSTSLYMSPVNNDSSRLLGHTRSSLLKELIKFTESVAKIHSFDTKSPISVSDPEDVAAYKRFLHFLHSLKTIVDQDLARLKKQKKQAKHTKYTKRTISPETTQAQDMDIWAKKFRVVLQAAEATQETGEGQDALVGQVVLVLNQYLVAMQSQVHTEVISTRSANSTIASPSQSQDDIQAYQADNQYEDDQDDDEHDQDDETSRNHEGVCRASSYKTSFTTSPTATLTESPKVTPTVAPTTSSADFSITTSTALPCTVTPYFGIKIVDDKCSDHLYKLNDLFKAVMPNWADKPIQGIVSVASPCTATHGHIKLTDANCSGIPKAMLMSYFEDKGRGSGDVSDVKPTYTSPAVISTTSAQPLVTGTDPVKRDVDGYDVEDSFRLSYDDKGISFFKKEKVIDADINTKSSLSKSEQDRRDLCGDDGETIFLLTEEKQSMASIASTYSGGMFLLVAIVGISAVFASS